MSSTPVLTVTQMYALARRAGLSPARAVTAAAVGMAESSGRAHATSPNPDGGTNVGIWQLDTRGKGAGYTVTQLQNPAINAKAMAKASRGGTDWSAWKAWADGTYAQYLGPAQHAEQAAPKHSSTPWYDTVLEGLGVAALGPAAGSAGSMLGSVLQLPAQVTGFLSALEEPVKAAMWLFQPGNWARIIAGIFGFFLLMAGLITLGLAA